MIPQLLLHVLLPLLAGMTVYLLFRHGTWLHEHLFSGFTGWLIEPRNAFTKVIAYNVPDFCWAYSFTSALLIWNNYSRQRLKYLPLLILLVLLLSECVQYWVPDYFTFDWADLVATSGGFLLSYFANRT